MEGSKFVVGIDPSMTGTGVAVIDSEGKHDVQRFGTKSLGNSVRERNQRYLRVIDRVISFIDDREPVIIAIEAYSFDSPNQNYIAEFGGILRSDLCVYEEVPIFEVAPSTLKKFVTGKGKTSKGKAGKEEMAASILNQWEVGFASFDQFEAYALGRMAACIAGFNSPENTKQAECLKTITHRSFEVGGEQLPAPQAKLPF